MVLSEPRSKFCDSHGIVIDLFDVWREGTHALYIDSETADAGAKGAPPIKIRVDTVAAHRGDRPWSPRWSPRAPSRLTTPSGLPARWPKLPRPRVCG
jgi:competence protein ComEC